MKKLMVVLALSLMTSRAWCSPLSDLIIGVAFMGIGGVFEIQRSSAKGSREDDEKKATAHAIAAVQADENAFYYLGAANWERTLSGQSSTYFIFLNTANSYNATALSEIGQSSTLSSSAGDNRDKQNLYKGISLTSFGVGGAFIIKAAVTYALGRHQTMAQARKYEWVKSFDMFPTPKLDGARLTYTRKFDL